MRILKAASALLLGLCSFGVVPAKAITQQVITGPYRKITATVATPVVVQVTSNTAACNFGGCVANFTLSVPSGDKIIVELINQDSSSSVSCTDDVAGTLTEQSGSPQATISGAGGGFYIHQLAEKTTASGATQITCSFSGSFAEMWVIQVRGGSGTATMQAASTSAYSFGNCSPSPSATPTSSPSIAFGIYWADVSGVSPGTGWTAIGTVSTDGSPLWMEYKAVTGTSSVSVSATNSCAAHGPDAYINIW